MDKKIIEMQQGKIYFISYGGTTLVGRYINSDACNHFFNEYLHNWAGYEDFRKGPNLYAVKSNIEEIREASDAEKQSLLRKAIEHNTI